MLGEQLALRRGILLLASLHSADNLARPKMDSRSRDRVAIVQKLPLFAALLILITKSSALIVSASSLTKPKPNKPCISWRGEHNQTCGIVEQLSYQSITASFTNLAFDTQELYLEHEFVAYNNYLKSSGKRQQDNCPEDV